MEKSHYKELHEINVFMLIAALGDEINGNLTSLP